MSISCVGLMVKLKASGTGSAKLEPVREHLAKHPKCTAADAVEVLRESGASELTMVKAETILRTGEYVPPEIAPNRSIEDELYEAELKAAGPVAPIDNTIKIVITDDKDDKQLIKPPVPPAKK